MSARPVRRRVVLAALISGALIGACEATAAREHAPTARSIEARLLAPCCWVQTLDVHESEVASELRVEIERRALAGESAGAIEDDLAARFGERVRAVPRGSMDPTRVVPFVGIAYLFVTLGALLFVARRWRANARATARESPSSPEPMHDEFERRLDEELARLDD